MLPISSQSLNGANSASRRAREVPKNGKSSEFNPRNYEQVKSSPSLTVWSHEGVKDTVKFVKKIHFFFNFHQTFTDNNSGLKPSKLKKIQKLNFKLAFRFGKILKIINARCGRRRFLRF